MEKDLSLMHKAVKQEITEIADLLQRELDEGSDITRARENNYHLLNLILKSPTLEIDTYNDILFKEYGINENANIEGQLAVSRLRFVSDRERISQIMIRISSSTYQLFWCKSSNVEQDFDDVAKIVRSRKFFERRIEAKLFLIAFTSLPSWEKENNNSDTLYIKKMLTTVSRQGSYKLCRETARRLVDSIGFEYGLEKRKTSTERVQEILEDVAMTRDLEDMRATLLIIQRESKNLKEQFEQEVRNQNLEYIKHFFIKMNSVRYGKLLDTIAQTEALLQKLQLDRHNEIPELQAIPMLIRVLKNFLLSEGVIPVKTIDSIVNIKGSDLANYEFVGNSIPKPDEIVKVIIRTPGWELGDTLISRPLVEEVNGENKV